MAKNGTRPSRSYSDFERVAVMSIALTHGIAYAVKATKTPERTVYSWFADAGGLAEIRNFANMAAENSVAKAEQALCDEVARRLLLEDTDTDQLLITYRKLLETRANVAAAGSSSSAAAGSSANAQVINVTVKE